MWLRWRRLFNVQNIVVFSSKYIYVALKTLKLVELKWLYLYVKCFALSSFGCF